MMQTLLFSAFLLVSQILMGVPEKEQETRSISDAYFVLCKQWVAKKEKSEISYQPLGMPLLLKIEREAFSVYPLSFFPKGAHLGIPVEIVIYGESETKELGGAFLLEVQRFYENIKELEKDLEKPLQELRILNFQSVIGSCCTGEGADLQLEIQAEKIEKGWAPAMIEKNLDLAHQAFVYFDCLLPVCLYYEWNSPKVNVLRYFEDEIMQGSEAGSAFLAAYKRWEPDLVRSLKDRPYTKTLVKSFLNGFIYLLVEMDVYSPVTKAKFDYLFRGLYFVSSPWLSDKPYENVNEGIYFVLE